MAMRVVSSDVGAERDAEKRRGKMMRRMRGSMSAWLVGKWEKMTCGSLFSWKDGSFCFFTLEGERCRLFE